MRDKVLVALKLCRSSNSRASPSPETCHDFAIGRKSLINAAVGLLRRLAIADWCVRWRTR